jgi:hypothetical protein
MSFPLPLVLVPRQDLFLTFLSFIFEKKDIFVCLRMKQGVSLWHFHVYLSIHFHIYPKLVYPLHFSPFYLSPLLVVISTGLNILYLFLYRKYKESCSYIGLCSLAGPRGQGIVANSETEVYSHVLRWC